MKIKIRRLTAFILALLLFFSPLLEIRPHAAEMAESLASGDDADKTQDLAESENAGEEKTGQASESETDAETDADAETAAAEDTLEDAPETAPEQGDETKETEESEETQYPCPDSLEPENTPHDENLEAFTNKLVRSARARTAIPAKYDAREEGYMPAVRDQGKWGACWSFSLSGAMEASMIRDMEVLPDSADLSERHLAYFGYNTGNDALGNANGDTMTCTSEDYYLTNGGNDLRGIVRLMNWNGGAAESGYPYDTATLPEKLDRTNAQDAAVYIENAYRYDFAEAQKLDKAAAVLVVKKMIADYGAVSWSYYSDSKYFGSDRKSYYNYEARPEGSPKTNHAAAAVGWDDNYARENFAAGHQPKNDGAWIIRNSYGSKYGENGYIYISYEDVSLGSANPVYAVTACDASKYDNNYFYGNTAFASATIAVRRAAQVYTMKSEKAACEKLTAVSLLIGTSDVKYELQIYKNPDMENKAVTNPTSGTPMLDVPQTGTLGYAGLHTIALDVPIVFEADDRVSVVFTFPDAKPSMYFDRSYTSEDKKQQGVHIVAKGQSFFSSSLTSWTDNYGSDRTFRINALTADCKDMEEILRIKEIRVTEAQDFNGFPKADLIWSKCTGAESYNIYRAEDGGSFELIDNVESSVREYTDNFPQRKAVQYQYRIAAVYGSSEKFSEAAAADVKGSVKGTKLAFADYDSYTAVIAWDEVAGADGYEFWGIPGQGADYVHMADFSADDARSYTVATDAWGANNYRVRAKRGDEYTDWGEICINRDLLWKQQSYYTAYFEWQPVEGAVSYKLWHKANGKTFSLKVNNKASVSVSMKSSNYLPCDKHQYYVEAYDAEDAGGSKIYTSSVINFKMAPDAPAIEAAEYDYGHRIALSWSSSAGTDRVRIYRTDVLPNTQELIAETGADTARYEDSVYKGKKYFYSFLPVSVNNKGEQVEGQSAVSQEIATFPDQAAIGTAEYAAGSGVTIAWNAAKGADGYSIERSDNNGGFSEIASIEDAAAAVYTDETVKIGNTYRYRVLSCFLTEEKDRAVLPAQEGISESGGIFAYGKDFWVNGIKDMPYTGAAIKQMPDVYDGKVLLTEGKDYTIAYKNNIKVSENETNPSKKPQVIVRGKGSYTGTQVLYFEILPEPEDDREKRSILEAKADSIKPLEYKGEALCPKPAVKYGKDTLTEGTHYTLSYENNDGAGTAAVVIKGINDYKGTKRVNFNINCSLQDDSSGLVEVTLEQTDVPYAKGGAKPSVTVKCNDRLLAEGTDYRLSYKNNNAAVSADDKKTPAVIITGKGNYKGKREVAFNIVKQDIGLLTLTAKDKVYSTKAGNFVTSFVITDKDGRRLSPGRDYDKTSVTYKYADTGIPVQDKSTVPVGTTLVISVNAAEKGAYYGTISGEYRIASYDIGKARVKVEAQTYTGEAIEPDQQTGLTVSYMGYDGGLAENAEYEITGYENNVEKGTATMYIKGIGDFCGTKAVKFKIKTKIFRWWERNEVR